MSTLLFATLIFHAERGRRYTYKEIAREMGISWQAVQQIEASGLRKLARRARLRKLLREMVDS